MFLNGKDPISMHFKKQEILIDKPIKATKQHTFRYSMSNQKNQKANILIEFEPMTFELRVKCIPLVLHIQAKQNNSSKYQTCNEEKETM